MESGDRAGPDDPTPRLFVPPLFLSPLKDSSAAAAAPPLLLPELARDRGEKMAFHQGRFAGGDEVAALNESSPPPPPPLGEDDDDEGEAEEDGSADGEAGVGDAVAADVAVAAAVVFAGRGRSIQRLFGELSPSLSLLRARMARDRGDWLATAARGDCADDAEKDEEGDREALVAAATPSPLWGSPNGEEGDTGAERLTPSCDCDGGDSGGRTRWPSDLRRAAPPAPPPLNEPPGAELGGCNSAKAAAALLLRA